MTMSVIITGSHGIPADAADELIRVAMDEVADACGATGLVLTCGDSSVDEAGLRWAAACGIAAESHATLPHGRTAPTRNYELLARADLLVLIWDGICASTRLLKRQAEERGLLIAEIVLPAEKRPRRSALTEQRQREAGAP